MINFLRLQCISDSKVISEVIQGERNNTDVFKTNLYDLYEWQVGSFEYYNLEDAKTKAQQWFNEN